MNFFIGNQTMTFVYITDSSVNVIKNYSTFPTKIFYLMKITIKLMSRIGKNNKNSVEIKQRFTLLIG